MAISCTAVVYFDQLLGAACTGKLVITLLGTFSTFFVDFQTFSVNFHLKTLLNIFKKLKKLSFSYSLKLVDMQMLVNSLGGYLDFVFFQLIFD